MLKDRLEIANNLAGMLFEAEAAAEDLIIKIGALANALPQAKSDVKLSAVVGGEAYGHVSGALVTAVETHGRMVALHHELDSIKNAIGLRNFQVVGTGDAAKILRPTGRNDEGTDIAAQAA